MSQARSDVLADVRRAGGWLRTMLPTLGTAPAAAGASALALGLVLVDALVPGAEFAIEADAACGLLPQVDDLSSGGGADGFTFALLSALRPNDVRFRTALRAFSATLAALPAVRASAPLHAHVLRADDGELGALCRRIEFRGVVGRGVDRRALGMALGARAFAAARIPGRSAFALQVVHAAVAARLDPTTTREAIAFVRRSQHVDGAFGPLPPSTPRDGDVRLRFHVPWTTAALRTFYDALAREPLGRAIVRASEKDNSPSP